MGRHYQRGYLRCAKRKSGSYCWEFLWREDDEAGKRVRRTAVIGSVDHYPTKEEALDAVNGLRMQVNADRNRQPVHPLLIADLIDHYVENDVRLEPRDQQLADFQDPAVQRRSADFQADVCSQNHALPMQRSVIAIFADDRVDDDAVTRQAFLDDPWWQRG